jgi:hypothetical protein
VDPARRARWADHNLTRVLEHFARHADGADLAERDGVLLFASGDRFTGAFHAGAVRTDPGADPAGVLRSARRFAGAHGRDLVIWASAHADADLARAAEAEGLTAGPAVVGMAIEVPPGGPHLPAGVDLVRVTDVQTAAEFAQVHRRVFAEAGRPETGRRALRLAPGAARPARRRLRRPAAGHAGGLRDVPDDRAGGGNLLGGHQGGRPSPWSG